MRYVINVFLLVLGFAGGAWAGDTVLTPTNLYTMIESLRKVDLNHSARVKALEAKQEEHLSRFEFVPIVKRVAGLEKRCDGIVARAELQKSELAELERKMAGVQKQITVLHAKIEPLEVTTGRLKHAAVLGQQKRNATK